MNKKKKKKGFISLGLNRLYNWPRTSYTVQEIKELGFCSNVHLQDNNIV